METTGTHPRIQRNQPTVVRRYRPDLDGTLRALQAVLRAAKRAQAAGSRTPVEGQV